MPDTAGSAPPAPAIDPGAMLQALRDCGADRFQPLRFRFLEALARRTVMQPEQARRLLEARLQLALADYRQRFAQAREAPVAAAADDRPPCGRVTLADLLDRLRREASAPADTADAPPPGREELKSLRYFSSTWSRLGAERRLNRALAQGPANAGPLNSHLLALQAMQRMRDISPDYLACFMSYLDTLLWLEQADNAPGRRKAGRSPAA